jgi:hypothetical protein
MDSKLIELFDVGRYLGSSLRPRLDSMGIVREMGQLSESPPVVVNHPPTLV